MSCCTDQAAADSDSRGRSATRTPPQRAPSGQQKGLRLERIERLGEEAWAGVAAVDRGDKGSDTLWRKALLLGGDTAALLAFAAIGRSNHGESLDFGNVLSVAWPFLTGWYGAASLLGGYSRPAIGGKAGPAAVAALKIWAVALPVAIALRSASRGYIPDKAFIIVSLVVTAVLLVGWRTGLAALSKSETVNGDAASQRKDKKGNPLEFLQLLTSLTKRW
ncbi:g10517 [Coccomyxa viridis]|uniref:G10517 protein n=1 Tax=Coccomyxa viridis TaxID=1274662 RepID=A0ABP1GBJ6_9CHLO